jgi:hypothetical protein
MMIEFVFWLIHALHALTVSCPKASVDTVLDLSKPLDYLLLTTVYVLARHFVHATCMSCPIYLHIYDPPT